MTEYTDIAKNDLKEEDPYKGNNAQILYEKGNEEEGIFHHILSKTTEPAISVSASSTEQGAAERVIEGKRTTTAFFGEVCKHSWVRIDLGETHKVNPTHYTICTRHEGEGLPLTYLRSWQLQASNDSINWIVLREHKSDLSLTEETPFHTWPVDIGDEHRRPFRYFQIVMDDRGNSMDNDQLCLSTVELFGELDNDTRKSKLNPAAREFVPASMRQVNNVGPRTKNAPAPKVGDKEQKVGHVVSVPMAANLQGMIKDSADQYYKFESKEVIGGKQPKNGDRVTFQERRIPGQPQPRAENILIQRSSRKADGNASPASVAQAQTALQHKQALQFAQAHALNQLAMQQQLRMAFPIQLNPGIFQQQLLQQMLAQQQAIGGGNFAVPNLQAMAPQITPQSPPAFNIAPGAPLVNIPPINDALKDYSDQSPFSPDGVFNTTSNSNTMLDHLQSSSGWSGMTGMMGNTNGASFTPPPQIVDDVVTSLLS